MKERVYHFETNVIRI